MGDLSEPVAEELSRGTCVAILPKAPEGFFQPPNSAGVKVQVVELPERACPMAPFTGTSPPRCLNKCGA